MALAHLRSAATLTRALTCRASGSVPPRARFAPSARASTRRGAMSGAGASAASPDAGLDAQADAVNALEAVFASGDAAASWDEDEEDDPEDLASQRRLDEIRKLFEIVDERDLDDEDGKGK